MNPDDDWVQYRFYASLVRREQVTLLPTEKQIGHEQYGVVASSINVSLMPAAWRWYEDDKIDSMGWWR